MGVSRCDYVVIGYRFESLKAFDKHLKAHGIEKDPLVDKYDDNAYKDEVGGVDGFCIIEDGMCGEYVLVGKVLVKGNIDKGSGMDLTRCDLDRGDLRRLKMKLKNEFKIEEAPRVWAVTHFH